jgi:hypothetical protein
MFIDNGLTRQPKKAKVISMGLFPSESSPSYFVARCLAVPKVPGTRRRCVVKFRFGSKSFLSEFRCTWPNVNLPNSVADMEKASFPPESMKEVYLLSRGSGAQRLNVLRVLVDGENPQEIELPPGVFD